MTTLNSPLEEKKCICKLPKFSCAIFSHNAPCKECKQEYWHSRICSKFDHAPRFLPPEKLCPLYTPPEQEDKKLPEHISDKLKDGPCVVCGQPPQEVQKEKCACGETYLGKIHNGNLCFSPKPPQEKEPSEVCAKCQFEAGHSFECEYYQLTTARQEAAAKAREEVLDEVLKWAGDVLNMNGKDRMWLRDFIQSLKKSV